MQAVEAKVRIDWKKKEEVRGKESTRSYRF